MQTSATARRERESGFHRDSLLLPMIVDADTPLRTYISARELATFVRVIHAPVDKH